MHDKHAVYLYKSPPLNLILKVGAVKSKNESNGVL